MRLTQPDFNELYPKIADYSDILYNKAKDSLDFKQNYLSSKIWRLNNLYTIVDKQGEEIIFEMNFAQHLTYSSALVHPRVIILKSRQQGISTLWLISFFDDAIFKPNTSVGLMAQGLDESEKLLSRIKILWDNMDPDVLAELGVRKIKENSKEIAFSNGSSIFIRTSFRSTTLQRLHISEYGKIANANPKRAKETKTGTMQAIAPGNNVAIESTAEGINDFKSMWDTAVAYLNSGQPLAPKDFYPVFLSWLDDPDCTLDIPQTVTAVHAKYFKELEEELGITIRDDQKNFWISQYRELGEETYQEYPATPEEAFRKVKDGTYYARLYRLWVMGKGRERTKLYDPNLPVFAAYDIGMDDITAIVYYQIFRGEVRIIDEFFDAGEAVSHYCEHMRDTGYNIEEVELPHDAESRCLQNGKTVVDSFIENYEEAVKDGYRGPVPSFNVQEKGEVLSGIENVRRMIKVLYVDTSCTNVRDAFLNYTKEWDDVKQVWKMKPKHDDYSHFADSIRYMANRLPSSLFHVRFGGSSSNEDTGVTDGLAI